MNLNFFFRNISYILSILKNYIWICNLRRCLKKYPKDSWAKALNKNFAVLFNSSFSKSELKKFIVKKTNIVGEFGRFASCNLPLIGINRLFFFYLESYGTIIFNHVMQLFSIFIIIQVITSGYRLFWPYKRYYSIFR